MGEMPQPALLSRLLPVPNSTLSYWRSEPHAIDEFCSTEELPAECDIAIIGAGLSGVATAYHLSKLFPDKKPSIVILEARQVCSGATGRNGGHVKIRTQSTQTLIKKHGLKVGEEITAFAREQIYLIKDAVESEGLDCEFELRRSYDVFIDENEAREAEKLFEKSKREKQRWFKDTDFVGAEFAEQVTSIKGAKAAISVPVCSLWPYKFVSQLLSRLLDSKAVKLYTWTPVTSIQPRRAFSDSILRTPRGTLAAKKAIFATNAYTSGLLLSYRDTIIPIKATACHITPDQPISPHLSHTYNIYYNHSDPVTRVDYLNPRPDGGIVVGGAQWTYRNEVPRHEWYDNVDDSTLLPNAHLHFSGLMQRHFKGWENSNAETSHLWTGIIGATTDEQPHVGNVPGHEGEWYVLAGFNGGGLAYVFSCAKGIAEMVTGVAKSFEQTGLPSLFEAKAERLRDVS